MNSHYDKKLSPKGDNHGCKPRTMPRWRREGRGEWGGELEGNIQVGNAFPFPSSGNTEGGGETDMQLTDIGLN